MSYDQEKTQGPPNELHDWRREQDAREKAAIGRERADRCNGQVAGCDPRPLMTEAQTLAELFRYHPPTPETLPKFSAINQAAKNFAEIVLQNCPSSADRSAAIRLIRDARMTANAAVALNGLSLY
jgi:hypothetical protein